MTLHEYAMALLKHWLVIVVLALLGVGAGYGISQLMDERFRAETTVMIIPARGDNTSELVQGSSYVQSLVETYTVLTRSPVVLEPVIERLGLRESAAALASRMDVDAPLDTVVIEIGVSDATGADAAEAADAIAAEFAIAVADTSPRGADGEPAVRVSVIAPARIPTVPFAPNTRLNMMLGAGVGIVTGVLIALALRRFGGRVSDVEDLHDATAAPVLGAIGRAGSQGVVVAIREHPSGRIAETVRQTAAALKFIDMDAEHQVLVVTSAAAGEGKSSTSLGLALTLAEVGSRVLLIEADLRRPSIAVQTGLEGAVGLTTVLVGDATLGDATQAWGHERLHVLPSGPKPPDPARLLTSNRLRSLFELARSSYDLIIVDSPPVLAVSDALWLAAVSDASILVVRAEKSRRDRIRKALAAMDGTPAPVLGIVLNNAALPKSPYDDRGPR